MRITPYLFCLLIAISPSYKAQKLHAIGLGDISIYKGFKEANKNPMGVQGLVLKGLKLKKIPVEKLKAYPNLVYLDLSNNKLDSVPATLAELAHLKVLNLSKNNIKRLPEEFYNLKELNYLYLGRNKIDYISHNIKNLISLMDLDLWNNDLLRLPPEIQDLPMLKRLDLRLTNLNREEQQKIKNGLTNVNISFSGSCDCEK